MKLLIINGSPRGKRSNSRLLLEQFLAGYHSVEMEDVPVIHLAGKNKREQYEKQFIEAEMVLLIFPLYTDAMPGIVKAYIENIAQLDFPKPKKLGYIVQSGFPEALQSTFLARYLEKWTRRLKCEYLGTVIRGGVEGIQIMPPMMTKKLFQQFHKLGEAFAENGAFNPRILADLAKPYRLSAGRRLFLRMGQLFGITDFYWNMNLKKNNAYEKRFDRPFDKA
jgi:hypothetical protein